MKLARKITFLFLVPFMGLLALLAYRGAHREIDIYESQVAVGMRLAGKALRPTFAEVWRVEGEARALEVLQKADASLVDMNVRWVPVESGTELAQSEGSVEVEQGNGGVARVSVWLPVVDDGVKLGALELSRTLDQEAVLSRRVIHDQLLMTLGTLLVATILSVVIGLGLLGRPLRTLTLHARRIGAGDLSSRVVLDRRDEIGDLAHELNAMAGELKAANQKLLAEADARVKTVEQLRHADRLSTVGKLAAGLAHELGTPLNVVGGRAKMIASGQLASESVLENAGIIRGQTERMTKIIRQLLDFARRGQAKKTRVDLNALSRNVLELLTPLARKRGAVLKFEGTDGAAVLDVDAGQIEQVLSNLVVNGVDAMSHGGELSVRIGWDRAISPMDGDADPGDYLRVDVRDRGTGIGKEDLEHVFEPFFTTKEVGEGTGLGLSVAHGIVRDHGGWIAVESEENRGTCFSVYLPRVGGLP